MGDMVELPSSGSSAEGYLAVPESGSGAGVIVIQEWWGLVPHIRDVADRFAEAGFVALAPDLYHGDSTTEPDEAGKLMMALNLDRATKDIDRAVDYLMASDAVTSPRLGVIGFCMGGGLAMALGAHRPDAIGAVAPFYGIIPWPDLKPDYSKLDARVHGHFAELDGFFNPEMAKQLEKELRDLGKDATITIHENADHAFFNDTRPEVYKEDHSAEAWDATIKLFGDVLL